MFWGFFKNWFLFLGIFYCIFLKKVVFNKEEVGGRREGRRGGRGRDREIRRKSYVKGRLLLEVNL